MRIENNETLDVRGTARFNGGTVTFKDDQIARTSIQQTELAEFPVDITELRVHDAPASFLPTTAGADDLGLIAGTMGTDSIRARTSDAKATTVTQYARAKIKVPAGYVTGADLQLRIRAGMITTVSDTTATVDVQAYLEDEDGAVGSDICATAAQTINSLTIANKDFVITQTGIAAGDILDVRIAIAITDSATATAVIGQISRIALMADTR